MSEQKKRGRPENNDNAVLTDIINDKEKLKVFKEAVANLVYHKRKIEADTLIYKEDVSGVSETYGLSKGLINAKVAAIVKEKEAEEADKLLTKHEMLTEV